MFPALDGRTPPFLTGSQFVLLLLSFFRCGASEHLGAERLPLSDTHQWLELLGAWGPSSCFGFSLSDTGPVSPSISSDGGRGPIFFLFKKIVVNYTRHKIGHLSPLKCTVLWLQCVFKSSVLLVGFSPPFSHQGGKSGASQAN